MAKDLPPRPPTVPPAPPNLSDPRMAAFLGGAQVQAPAGAAQVAQTPPAEPPPAPPLPPERVIKDGFSMPQGDYDLIEKSMERALDHRIVMTKSGILRAAVRALTSLDEEAFVKLVSSVEEIKPGRKRGR